MPLSPELSQWRRTQRAELLALRMAIPAAQRMRMNRHITDALQDAFPLAGPLVIAAYWPFKGEFDPRFVLRSWRLRGACTALPVVVAKGQPLQFRAWWPGMRTEPGVYQLPVPVGSAVVRPDVVLMPPIGFDRQGYRLGYGGGFYDRTLAALSPQPVKIGVAFGVSAMPTIEPQPHDVPMDFVATEDGIRAVENQSLTAPLGPDAVRQRLDRLLRSRSH
ncbi:MAG: 5-formyltetrahydrofolate cyclo-ligase [Burkholderiaceae bacterium]